jgi:hypothetical protein
MKRPDSIEPGAHSEQSRDPGVPQHPKRGTPSHSFALRLRRLTYSDCTNIEILGGVSPVAPLDRRETHRTDHPTWWVSTLAAINTTEIAARHRNRPAHRPASHPPPPHPMSVQSRPS